MSFAAVLIPTPGIPGMLSETSPASARRSGIFSGGTPYFSLTVSGSYHSTPFVLMFSMRTFSETTCIRSLSKVKIITLYPLFSPSSASV